MKTELDFIWRRRSIRKYTAQPVAEELIQEILQAGMAAPSAHNRQPWHFIIVRERQTLDQIAAKHPYAKMLFGAPLAIAVCGNTTISAKRWDQDCAAATENILLSLPALGLGGVWIGYHPVDTNIDFLRSLFNLPDHIRVFSLVAIGYPDEIKEPRTQFDPALVHYEKW